MYACVGINDKVVWTAEVGFVSLVRPHHRQLSFPFHTHLTSQHIYQGEGGSLDLHDCYRSCFQTNTFECPDDQQIRALKFIGHKTFAANKASKGWENRKGVFYNYIQFACRRKFDSGLLIFRVNAGNSMLNCNVKKHLLSCEHYSISSKEKYTKPIFFFRILDPLRRLLSY